MVTAPRKRGYIFQEGNTMSTSFTITVHGKDLDSNLLSMLSAAGLMWDDCVLSATAKHPDTRDNIVSTLVANGFKVESSYRADRGWKVWTTGTHGVLE